MNAQRLNGVLTLDAPEREEPTPTKYAQQEDGKRGQDAS
jgi:hypothetical protein